jgi:hypothetical protein
VVAAQAAHHRERISRIIVYPARGKRISIIKKSNHALDLSQLESSHHLFHQEAPAAHATRMAAAIIWLLGRGHQRAKGAAVGDRQFRWQEGYSAFSVSPSNINGVKKYIANQASHHRKVTYLSELRRMLTLARIEFDPHDFI